MDFVELKLNMYKNRKNTIETILEYQDLPTLMISRPYKLIMIG